MIRPSIGRAATIRATAIRRAMALDARRAKLVADLSTGAVIVSVAIALGGLTWRLAGFAGTAAPAIGPAAPPAAGPADVAAAIAFAPFGRDTGGAASPTALPLELHGVVLATPRAASTALIAPAGGRPIAYAIGQSVGGATIDDIAMDHVLLRVSGRAELLAFPRFGAPAASATAASPMPSPLPPGGPSDARPIQPLVAAPAPDLIAALGATPTGTGYRIGTPPSDMATRAGLQAGDVIQTVNGQQLGDPARDRQTIAAAGAAGAVRIDLLRGGQRITLSMPLR